METSLKKIINSQMNLTIEHVQFFMYQLIRTLVYLHSANIAHLGLSPSNILLNSNEDIKIYNFLYSKPEGPCVKCFEITDNTYLRWYQAPEVLNFNDDYSNIGTKADIWSAGCILVEMIIRTPLFPGQDFQDQLRRIKDFMIINDFVEGSENYNRKNTYGYRLDTILVQPKNYKIRKFQHIDIETITENNNHYALDLVKKMLEFEEEKRITAKECLEHEFFRDLHFPQDEPLALKPFDWGFLDLEMDIDAVKEIIFNDTV
ncbi:hypothetical protein SteCoe_28140 [Stentor coeruleus]|uniref:Protein kinase domain-containing protein n=1 Tax=Stentor coeruleus TaxID=5963 RepID=A0A1R2B8W6_9CILI|nr:hypothetical protein SteCoe_28140 [Stentor coeruleus]